MHAAEIVISEPKRDRRGVVLNFLRKRIGQTCETPYAHPHAEILALHKRCAYVLRIGIAHDGFHFTTDTGCRTVPPLSGDAPKILMQLRVVRSLVSDSKPEIERAFRLASSAPGSQKPEGRQSYCRCVVSRHSHPPDGITRPEGPLYLNSPCIRNAQIATTTPVS